MPNLERIQRFNQATEGYKPEDRGSKSSVVRTMYEQNVRQRLKVLDKRPDSLFGAVVSYDMAGANLPLLGTDKELMDRAKNAASDRQEGGTSPKKSAEVFSLRFYNGMLTDGERIRLKAIIAREQAIKTSLGELRPIIEAVQRQKDHFSISPEDGRFLLKEEVKREPIEYDFKHLFRIKDLLLDVPEEVRHLSPEKQASFIADCLVNLARRHTPDAVLDDKFIQGTQAAIAESLKDGKPLCFSVFLSMEKFANPFDTKDSHVDFGELQMALEMSAFISNIEKVTGKKPTLIVMNESPVTQQFTHASEVIYRTEFLNLLHALGIQDQIEFVNFDFDFFKEYLQNRGYSSYESNMLTTKIFDVMRKAYFGISERKVKKENIAELVETSKNGENVGLPENIANKLGAFLEENFDALAKETEQAIQTESKRSIDPSILFPKMSESLWSLALDKVEASEEMKATKGSLKRFILEQAKMQGLFFKALMRMRYAYKEIFGDPVLSSEIIPLSITNAPNKWSIPFGRYPKTDVVIDSKEVSGVGPQHSAGVINNGRIISIPWDIIVKNPDSFHAAEINLGETKVSGYIHTKKGVVTDWDGTLDTSDKTFYTIYNIMKRGIPFGIATGRGQESIQRRILTPFKEFLTLNGLSVDDRLLYISGNNGAVATVGIEKPKRLYELPLDIQHILNLPEGTELRELVEAYVGGELTLERLQETDGYDEFCLYLEKQILPRAIEKLGLQDIPLAFLVSSINKDLKHNRIPVRAVLNTEGIDIVHENATKGLAMSRYREYYGRITGKKLHTDHILSIGDNPEGNDYELVARPSGNSEITKQGVEEVTIYINKQLNNV